MDSEFHRIRRLPPYVFAEVNKRFPTLPFAIRAFDDPVGAKVGVKECVDHDLLTGYPVLTEKTGEFVAQFKSTIAVLPRSTVVLAGDIPLAARYESDKKIADGELTALIASDLWKKEDKKKGKKDEEKKA